MRETVFSERYSAGSESSPFIFCKFSRFFQRAASRSVPLIHRRLRRKAGHFSTASTAVSEGPRSLRRLAKGMPTNTK